MATRASATRCRHYERRRSLQRQRRKRASLPAVDQIRSDRIGSDRIGWEQSRPHWAALAHAKRRRKFCLAHCWALLSRVPWRGQRAAGQDRRPRPKTNQVAPRKMHNFRLATPPLVKLILPFNAFPTRRHFDASVRKTQCSTGEGQRGGGEAPSKCTMI